jgi:hypothetical protein
MSSSGVAGGFFGLPGVPIWKVSLIHMFASYHTVSGYARKIICLCTTFSYTSAELFKKFLFLFPPSPVFSYENRGDPWKMMKSEVDFEHRSEAYWQVRRARSGKIDEEFAFSMGLRTEKV